MKQVLLDLRKMDSMEEVHDLLQRELSFPEYYGRNLDALADVLTDISEDIALFVIPDQTNDEKTTLGKRLNRVLSDCAEENDYLHLTVVQ